MNSKNIIKWSFFAISILAISNICLGAPPPEQETGGQERMRQMQDAEKALREKIETKESAPAIEQNIPETALPEGSEQKVSVKKITVTGVTLFRAKEINSITAPFENKELSLKEMQKAANLITDLYRKNGYITSRAYIPPQKIGEGSLEITVLEAAMGDVEVKGNQFFKDSLFKKKITMKKGEPFNYNTLKKNLVKINERQDRKARAVLMPSKGQQGGTDTALEVKDNLPIHLGLAWDNFGSRFIDSNRYAATLTHNNITGRDDILTLQCQLADEDEQYRLSSLRYLFPANNTLDIGFYAARTSLSLTRDYEALMARGKSEIETVAKVIKRVLP